MRRESEPPRTCDQCEAGEGYGALTFEEVLDDHIRPLNAPSWLGAKIGHETPQFSLPVRGEVEIDAMKAAIGMLESAVPLSLRIRVSVVAPP